MARVGNNRARWVLIGLTVLSISAAIITSFVWAKADIKAVDTKVDTKTENLKTALDELKREGTLPARANVNSIGKIETRLESIDGHLKSLDTRQTAGFKAVMEKLEKK